MRLELWLWRKHCWSELPRLESLQILYGAACKRIFTVLIWPVLRRSVCVRELYYWHKRR